MMTSAAFMLCFLLVLHILRKFFKQCNMILPPIQLKIDKHLIVPSLFTVESFLIYKIHR